MQAELLESLKEGGKASDEGKTGSLFITVLG